MKGTTKKSARLNSHARRELSERIENIRKCIPRDFSRQPRGVDELDRWKVTEYQLFLLYTGRIVLHLLQTDEQYQHFVLFSCDIAIITRKNLLVKYSDFVQELLESFIKKGREIHF